MKNKDSSIDEGNTLAHRLLLDIAKKYKNIEKDGRKGLHRN